MALFEDLDQFLDDTLQLPVGGKIYTIGSPDAELGLWIQRVMSVGVAIHQGQTPSPPPPLRNPDGTTIEAKDGFVQADEALYRRLLGPVWDELRVDGVPWLKIEMVAQTAMIWIATGVDAAQAFWRAGGRPEAQAPNRRARRSTSTAGANTIKPVASTNGMKSRATVGKR